MSHLHSVNFPAYEEISKQFHISAAVCIPTGCRLVATSGHVGIDDNGDVKIDLREQIECSFQVGQTILLPHLVAETCLSSQDTNIAPSFDGSGRM